MEKEIINKEFSINNISDENKEIKTDNFNNINEQLKKINAKEMTTQPNRKVNKKPIRREAQTAEYRKKHAEVSKKRKKKSFWAKLWGY